MQWFFISAVRNKVYIYIEKNSPLLHLFTSYKRYLSTFSYFNEYVLLIARKININQIERERLFHVIESDNCPTSSHDVFL